MKASIGIVVLALLLGGAQAQVSPEHEVSPVSTAPGSVSLAAFDRRIEAKAAEYRTKYAGAEIARTIEYDLAFPRDAAEFQSLNGYAVMLVSAGVHDQTELPLARVTFTLGGQSADLPVIARARRAVTPGSVAFSEFGPWREDVFVLVPAVLLFTQTSFQADFAAHRSGFDFARGPMSAPAYLAADKSLVSLEIKPSPATEALMALVRREYPGF